MTAQPDDDQELVRPRDDPVKRIVYGCPSCFEDHPLDTMCPPHEDRTTGTRWYDERLAKCEIAIRTIRRERDEARAALEEICVAWNVWNGLVHEAGDLDEYITWQIIERARAARGGKG